MIRLFLLLITVFYIAVDANADGKRFATGNIKPELLKHADAVIRFHEKTVEIESPRVVYVTEHYVITILNKKAKDKAFYGTGFSKLQKIERQYGYIYDEKGDLVTRIKESDFREHVLTVAPAEYDDDKIKVYMTDYNKYPFTLEVFTRVKQLHSFILPEWTTGYGDNVSAELSSFTARFPKDYELRYRSVNGDLKPEVKTEEKQHIYTWLVKDIPAVKTEFMNNELYDGYPSVLLASSDFALGDMNGRMVDWKSLGTFIYELNKGRDELTQDKKLKVKELTALIQEPREKVQVLYKYLQEHTRYVSIQYGIGGWQTMDARFLSNNNYGDCKALTNYMMAMLREAGITSYPVIISSGAGTSHKMIRDFPVARFNHVILCVPMQKDTVWLECTNTDFPAGYLGSFTANRDALIITPEGGIVAHTPCYGKEMNVVTHNIKAVCRKDGLVDLRMRNTYTGIVSEPLLKVATLNDHDRNRYIDERFNLDNYESNKYRISRMDRPGLLGIGEEIDIIAVANRISRSGHYQILDVNFTPLKIPFQTQEEERRTSFQIVASITIQDSVEIELPETVKIDAFPRNINTSTTFGQYTVAADIQAEKVIVTGKLVINEGVYQPEQFKAYETWVNEINSQSYHKLVLKNK